MMYEYQNIFTRVQVHGPVDYGVPMKPGNWPREKGTTTNWLMGILGDSQIGPIYLGTLGIAASPRCSAASSPSRSSASTCWPR